MIVGILTLCQKMDTDLINSSKETFSFQVSQPLEPVFLLTVSPYQNFHILLHKTTQTKLICYHVDD